MGLMKKLMLSTAAAAITFATSSAFAETRIQGAGATFPAPLYATWIKTYNAKHPDVKIDYQAIGSGGGIKGITDQTVQFAGSDAPMSADQEKKAPSKLLHLPTVAGPEVMIFNLGGVSKLTLDGPTIAGIYNKQITKWNDAKIAALNPGVAFPNKAIVVVHRSDGSGTSYIFTCYLSKVSKEWADGPGFGTTVDWPTGIGGKGNPGVADAVKGAAGSIGYVESAYAESSKLNFASQVNKAGKTVTASIPGVEAAAAEALQANLPADLKVSIVDSADPASYPICGFTYLLVYQDMSYIKDQTVATETLNFINWCYTEEAQSMAKDQGYAKLPKEVTDKVHEKLKSITFNGQPILK